MIYGLEIVPAAQKELSLLPLKDRKRVDDRIRSLADHPRPRGAIALTGHKGLYRLRVGNYRVIYQIRDEVLRILIVKVGHRREVYRNL